MVQGGQMRGESGACHSPVLGATNQFLQEAKRNFSTTSLKGGLTQQILGFDPLRLWESNFMGVEVHMETPKELGCGGLAFFSHFLHIHPFGAPHQLHGLIQHGEGVEHPVAHQRLHHHPIIH